MDYYVIVEGVRRDELVDCTIHGIFDTLKLALAFGNKYLDNDEWHVAFLDEIKSKCLDTCQLSGWSL